MQKLLCYSASNWQMGDKIRNLLGSDIQTCPNLCTRDQQKFSILEIPVSISFNYSLLTFLNHFNFLFLSQNTRLIERYSCYGLRTLDWKNTILDLQKLFNFSCFCLETQIERKKFSSQNMKKASCWTLLCTPTDRSLTV